VFKITHYFEWQAEPAVVGETSEESKESKGSEYFDFLYLVCGDVFFRLSIPFSREWRQCEA
jgi:hypothetical protein